MYAQLQRSSNCSLFAHPRHQLVEYARIYLEFERRKRCGDTTGIPLQAWRWLSKDGPIHKKAKIKSGASKHGHMEQSRINPNNRHNNRNAKGAFAPAGRVHQSQLGTMPYEIFWSGKDRGSQKCQGQVILKVKTKTEDF